MRWKVNWKRFYHRELESPRGKRLVERLFCELRGGDHVLLQAIRSRGIISFPHTALGYSGPLIMRTVVSLLRTTGLQRVVALGVLHMGTLPEPYAGFYGSGGSGWERLAGGFVPVRPTLTTPFGEVPLAGGGVPPPVQEDRGILGNEFSLDTFLAMYAYAAGRLGMDPPPVLPVYVGLTRDPDSGSFAVAGELARALSDWLGSGTALVTTGDVVHYGRPYGDDPASDELARDVPGLTRHFRTLLVRALELALGERDYAGAYRVLGDLKSDQRHVLPVIAELLGPGAGFRVHDFSLSDYAPIFRVAPPCLVASTLITYMPSG